jgi:putative hemolysin
VTLRIFGVDPHASRDSISGEELRDIVATHEELTDEERELIDEVFEAQDRELREVMQPRTEVDFLDGELPVRKAAKVVSEMPHSRYPVIGESPDDVLGFVHIRDIFDPAMAERSIRLSDLVRELPRFPGTKRVIPTLSEMRRNRIHFALVEDEYGGTAGIVTLEDLVEELIGDIRDEYDDQSIDVQVGELVVDGVTNIEDVAELTDLELPEGPYETLAGFIMAQVGKLPEAQQSIEVQGYRLTVLEVENRRATKVKIERLPEPQHTPS